MKYLLIVLFALLAFTVQAGTLTINTTAPQDARIVAAFGKQLNTMDMADPDNPVPRDATGEEVKQAVIQYIKQVVFTQERRAARQAADATVPDLNPN